MEEVANMLWFISFEDSPWYLAAIVWEKGDYLYIAIFYDYVWTCMDTSKCTNQDKKIINTFGAKLVSNIHHNLGLGGISSF
jgi:hypothetical protein